MRTTALAILATLLLSTPAVADRDNGAKRKAKAAAKVVKARAKVAAAVAACRQAVIDACVEGAAEDGSTDCLNTALVKELAACYPRQRPESDD